MRLAVKNLSLSYGAIKARRDVSVHIDKGEIVTLIGANGAGKTTLLRTISGLLKATGGTIEWEGREIQKLKAHEIVRLGISQVPEGRQVFPKLSVRENLLLGAYQHRASSQIQADMERMFGLFPILSERSGQKAGTLSGGEQQMLAMGRALMSRPTLLLLDEPSLGLAPLIVRTVFQIIREINSQGTTIFLVEQNAHMALGVAHRGYVMQSGQVILTDKAGVLLENAEVKKAYLGG